MCSLNEFPMPPRRGLITLCEAESELVSVESADEPHHRQLVKVPDYPQVTIATETLRSSLGKHNVQSAFLQQQVTCWRKAIHAWHERGIMAALEELTSNKSTSSWMKSLARLMLTSVRLIHSLHGSIFPHLMLSSDDMIAEFSETLDWCTSPVRAFAWHHHTIKFALALKDDSVRIYSSKSDLTPILKYKLQRGVADLAWKPFSASLLAVACQTCVLVWTIDPSSLSTRLSASCVQVLTQNGHGPVTSVAWNHNGGILVSASAADTAMMVWDVAKDVCVPLRRVGGGGVSLLRWSPDGSKLFSATPSPVFRVWQTRTWTCEKWSQMSSRCQAACWSPDGTILLFANADQPVIYYLTFSKASDQNVIGGSKSAVSIVDLSQITIDDDGVQVTVGGFVQSMAWDPSGERLAVTFKDQDCESYSNEFIAIFRTRILPVFEIAPCGFVRGDPGDVPQIISFQDNFDNGAMLTVCWDSGKVSFVPLYFVPYSSVLDNKRLNAIFNYDIRHRPSSTLMST